MTYKEEQKAIIRAKHWMHDVIDYHQDVLDGEEPGKMEKTIFEECEVILNALEKQIPHKIRPKTSLCAEIPVCGKCNGIMDLAQGELNYCPNCGQKLDWSDEE